MRFSGDIGRLILRKNASRRASHASSSSSGHAHDGRQGLAGEVVFGGADAAGEEQQIAGGSRVADGGFDVGLAVADGGVANHVAAHGGELLAQPGGVGIDGLAEDQFVADGENDGPHSGIVARGSRSRLLGALKSCRPGVSDGQTLVEALNDVAERSLLARREVGAAVTDAVVEGGESADGVVGFAGEQQKRAAELHRRLVGRAEKLAAASRRTRSS